MFAEHYDLYDNGLRKDVTDTRYNTDGTAFSQTKVNWVYDADDRLTSEALVVLAGGSNAPAAYTDVFKFDLDGNRIEEDISGSQNATVTYTYNANNELGTETRIGDGAYSTTDGYDNAGNLTSQVRTGTNPDLFHLLDLFPQVRTAPAKPARQRMTDQVVAHQRQQELKVIEHRSHVEVFSKDIREHRRQPQRHPVAAVCLERLIRSARWVQVLTFLMSDAPRCSDDLPNRLLRLVVVRERGVVKELFQPVKPIPLESRRPRPRSTTVAIVLGLSHHTSRAQQPKNSNAATIPCRTDSVR